MSEKYFAHVKKDAQGQWDLPHDLRAHLLGTASLAEASAAKFGSGEWGRALGLAHDAGKARDLWQSYLRHKSGYDEDAHLEGKKGKEPHAIYGAVLLEKLFGKQIGRLLAYGGAGHHAGLPDWSGAEGAGAASLEYQKNQSRCLGDIAPFVGEELSRVKIAAPPWKFARGLDLSLWVRMLYSVLVDADFLDTEAYMDEGRTALRGCYDPIPVLLGNFNAYMKELEDGAPQNKLNDIRREVGGRCRQMAQEPQGVFSLSVPTGGGKTLSSLAFGLEHAHRHDLDRIIYVIPYTSIIEQNVEVIRSAVDPLQVIEHHSGLDDDATTAKSRLAAENWDAPVVVTTTVQFFESLFAAHSSRCRKLHNICNSVVVLDEAQLLPVEYLEPILQTMQLLVDRYRVTFVICTATQPAFGPRLINGKMFKGLRDVREIMEGEVDNLHHTLRRVNIRLPTDLTTASEWTEIAAEIIKHHQVLCVVSDRTSCRELYSLLPEGTVHLSALMCGQHRSTVIAEIKEKLAKNEQVRVVSTQLVEAGVDLDFPVVYRALAGLDSIVQAAGRCNREGKLKNLGTVHVFVPPRRAPAGILRKAADTARGLFGVAHVDPLDHTLFQKYFSELYWKANSLDAVGIIGLLEPDQSECAMFFRTAAAKFKLIDESMQRSVIVPYGDSKTFIAELRSRGLSRRLGRSLQRYMVNIYLHEFNAMLKSGLIEEVLPFIYVVTSDVAYCPIRGLLVDAELYHPEQFIID